MSSIKASIQIFIISIFFSCSNSSIKEKSYPTFSTHNPVFNIPNAKDLKSDEVFFRVEIPTGDNRKFELRTSTGAVIMDRTLCKRQILNTNNFVKNYPFNYGISPGRFNIDGDALDLVVLGGNEVYKKMVDNNHYKTLKVKILGIIKMQECSNIPCLNDGHWEDDWKILAIHINKNDENTFHSIKDIPKKTINKINTFFSNYKGPKKVNNNFYPQTRVNGVISKKETLYYLNTNFKITSKKQRFTEIKNCHKIYKNRIENKNFKKSIDSQYLTCLQRVHSEYFFPNSKHFSNFLKYSMYQRILELNQKDVTMENAIEKMKLRKKNGLTYYRYVSYDSPGPGTNQAVFELVKTKNRNTNCPLSFKNQHYKDNPLIDI